MKLAATEDITNPLAEFPNATAWQTTGHPSPGPGFYLLRKNVGGNDFYGTLPTNPLELLRHYKANPPQNAQKQPYHHLKFHAKAHHERSFAPPPIKPRHPERRTVQSSHSADATYQDQELKHSPSNPPESIASTIAARDETAASAQTSRRTYMPEAGIPSSSATPSNLPFIHRLPLQGRSELDRAITRRQNEIPSIAPIPTAHGVTTMAQLNPAPHAHAATATASRHAAKFSPSHHIPHARGADSTDAPGTPSQTSAANHAAETADVQKAVREYFNKQSRLPPAGGTAFDPYLTPAWPGLKIPSA